MDTTGIPRRDFLRGAVTAGSVLAAASVLNGCSTSAQNTTSSEVDQEPEGIGTPPAIADSEIGETIDCNVVVCGAGISGIAAARAAAEAGARVVILEKKETIEVHGFQFGALNCTLAREAGVNEESAAFVRDYQRRSSQRGNMKLIRLWTENSGNVFDWWTRPVEDDTAVMGNVTICYWPRSSVHDRAGDLEQTFIGTMDFKEDPNNPVGGAAWIATAQANQALAAKEGVDFHFLTVARELLVDNGKVTGVIAANADGTYLKINAGKGVILCTGGLTNFFGQGAELLMKLYCPEIVARYEHYNGAEPDWEPMFTSGSAVLAGNTGDGHLMALWAGAQMEPFPEATMGAGDSLIGATVALEVNGLGERCWNEDVGIWQKHDAILGQPGQFVWEIFDVNWRDRLPYQGVGHRNLDVNDTPYDAKYTGNEYIEAIHDTLLSSVGKTEGAKFADAFNETDGTAYGANTLDELARLIDVPADALKATVARYNEMAAAKNDVDFGTDPQKLFPIDTAPFFATKAKGSAGLTAMSGLLTDGNLQCVDADGNVIPGLWAAGTTAGQRFQPYYQTPMSGLNHGFGITHGYLAGQYAAQA